jgi:hypothetical protein
LGRWDEDDALTRDFNAVLNLTCLPVASYRCCFIAWSELRFTPKAAQYSVNVKPSSWAFFKCSSAVFSRSVRESVGVIVNLRNRSTAAAGRHLDDLNSG